MRKEHTKNSISHEYLFWPDPDDWIVYVRPINSSLKYVPEYRGALDVCQDFVEKNLVYDKEQAVYSLENTTV